MYDSIIHDVSHKRLNGDSLVMSMAMVYPMMMSHSKLLKLKMENSPKSKLIVVILTLVSVVSTQISLQLIRIPKIQVIFLSAVVVLLQRTKRTSNWPVTRTRTESLMMTNHFCSRQWHYVMAVLVIWMEKPRTVLNSVECKSINAQSPRHRVKIKSHRYHSSIRGDLWSSFISSIVFENKSY